MKGCSKGSQFRLQCDTDNVLQVDRVMGGWTRPQIRPDHGCTFSMPMHIPHPRPRSGEFLMVWDEVSLNGVPVMPRLS